MLYLALLRSKLEYGSFLYDTAAKSNLIILDRIQYKAIRIMLGALKCTNVNKLEMAAQILPLSLLRKKLLAQYICRALTVQNQPVRKLYTEYYPFEFYINNKCPLSAIGRAYNELKEMNINTSTIPCMPQHLRHSVPNFPVHNTLAKFKKGDMSGLCWRQIFQDMIEQNYSDRTLVYCDGSVRGEESGMGVWSKDFQLMTHLPSGLTIYSVELYALYACLAFLARKPGNFLIISDSLSSIKSLQNGKLNEHYLLLKIAEIFQSIPKGKIIIEWTPSHMGIWGNEKADSLAKASVTLSTVNKIPFLKRELKCLIAKHYNIKWQNMAARSNISKNLEPIICRIRNRKQQIIISRLQLGATMLTFGHHINKTCKELCSLCKCNVNEEHIMIKCPLYKKERKLLQMACDTRQMPMNMESILSGEFPHEIVLTFLGEIGYIGRI